MTTDDEMAESPEWALTKKLDEAIRDRDNERFAREAIEKEFNGLVSQLDIASQREKAAWRERDEAVAGLRETQELLRQAVRLIAYFAGKEGL